ncbi:hypothetical protein L873DRAFT_1028767 [Choiromyces venosus 120613-1]|uniref:Uncharacterized protein n=1 Tax=Choiromyces venosus 120613-1 TaxID=1336337 RepID=A0A3N4JJQ0_9PEZI|nr:hypothetical protein L873DRAFT_1028767 [Choiromyces venosus 120613-1]
MTTPHRGLPPPPAMALPSSTQTPSGIGQLPHQWHGSEDMFKTWLLAKMEEERRKAEEEKTKQEQIRGDTRRIELEMLRESARFSIPPPLIPIVLAGGGAVTGAGGEWLNDYISQHMGHLIQQQHQMVQQQPQHHQQQVHQMPPVQQPTPAPSLRRETRVIGQQSGGPAPHPQQMGPPPQAGMVPPQAAQVPPPPPPPQSYIPTYQLPSGSQRGGPQQPPPHPPLPMQQPGPLARLPKLDTNDRGQPPQQPPMHTGMPPTPMGGHPGGPPIQHAPQSSQQPPTQPETSVSQSPSIFFYHWQPPHSTSVGTSTPVQATASPQGQLGSPFNRQPQPNQITGPEYTNSPKKRKTSTQQGPSAAAPQSFSPSFPVTPLPTNTPRTRRGHSRHRSETAGSGARGYEPYPKTAPSRGHRRSIGESSVHESGPPPGDNGGGGPHHPHEQHQHEQQQHQQQHQQHQQQQQQQQHAHHQQQRPPSVPPPPLQQHRPYSPKSEGRRETYQPPPSSQPPLSEGGEGDSRSKSRNSNGRD